MDRALLRMLVLGSTFTDSLEDSGWIGRAERAIGMLTRYMLHNHLHASHDFGNGHGM